jgi:hypothetical protein
MRIRSEATQKKKNGSKQDQFGGIQHRFTILHFQLKCKRTDQQEEKAK